MYLSHYFSKVGGEEFDRYGQQDDSKNLANYIDALFAQNFLQSWTRFQNNINNQNVDQYGNNDIDQIVFCP